jgi:hypothetical protein
MLSRLTFSKSLSLIKSKDVGIHFSASFLKAPQFSTAQLLKGNQLRSCLLKNHNKNISSFNGSSSILCSLHVNNRSILAFSRSLSFFDPYNVQQRSFSSFGKRSPTGGGGGGDKRSRFLTVAASVGAIAVAKAKYVLVGLKLAKITPLISMLISTGAYAMFWGWPYAAGMVGLIFVHGEFLLVSFVSSLFRLLFLRFSLLCLCSVGLLVFLLPDTYL